MSSPVPLLPAAVALTGNELFYAVQNRGDVQVTAGQLKSFAGNTGGFAFTVGSGNTLNFYVATTGSDSNTGDSVPHAWATIQHAFDFITSSVNLAGGTVIINVGSGTFNGPTIHGSPTGVGGLCQLYGNGSANTTITNGAFTAPITVMSLGYTLALNGFTLSVPSFASGIRIVSAIGEVDLGDAINGATGDIVVSYQGFSGFLSNQSACLVKELGGTGVGQGVINFNGHSSLSIVLAQLGIYNSSWTWNVFGNGSNSPQFIQLGSQAQFGGLMPIPNYVVVSGSITGQRFQVGGGATVSGGSALGPQFFPGSTDGTGDRISGYDGYIVPQVPNVQTSSYHFLLTDISRRVEGNSSGALTFTVDTDATTDFPIGSEIEVTQTGAGAVTIAAAVGVTGNNFGAIGGQWKSQKIYKTAANTWTQTQV